MAGLHLEITHQVMLCGKLHSIAFTISELAVRNVLLETDLCSEL